MPLKMYQESQSDVPKIQNIIAVAAGKGGVGKSTVTVNLALALRFLGYSVGIMDTDIYGPSIRKMLPESRLPTQNGNTIIPAQCHGIQMISMAYFRKHDEAAAVRAPIANGVITQFIKNVEWGSLDYLLIDFPPGTGDIQLTLSQQANLSGAIMVTTPQEVSLMDVRKAMHLFEQVRIPIIGIVENMSYYHHSKTNETLYLFGKGGGKRLASETGNYFLGEVPIDPVLSQSCDEGKSIFIEGTSESSQSREVFIHLAKKVIEQLSVIEKQSLNPVKKIEQKDDHTFVIEWSDGIVGEYRLSDIQKSCPCANCVDEVTGKRRRDPASIDPDVRATQIASVGRYAVRIAFTSGCSTGIYHFDTLYKMARQ